tara:strand:+ start:1274 stop:2014 length:741 start_codon:yes stop_codon:yes gene_type:complete
MFKRLKEKYIKNTLTYKSYRIKKFKPFVSYSSFGEEILVNRIFKDKKDGFFVDVGAFNPVVGSLTKILYDKGWKGINLDFSETNINLFKIFRKRDISIKTGVSDKNAVKKSFTFDPSSGTNTLNEEYAKGWSKKFYKNYKIENVRCRTLNTILKENNISRNFDYLNIDVEAHDYEVLQGINLDLFKPRLITCEIIGNLKKISKNNTEMYFTTTEELIDSKINKYLKKYKYKLVSQYYLTAFFIKDN